MPEQLATCTVCGREFAAAGSVAEVISEAQGAPPDRLRNLRAHQEHFEATHGGARGVCSARCAWQAALNVFKEPS